MKLHDVGLTEKAGLSAAAAADHHDILISRVLRVFGAVTHHKALRFRQQHIVVKDGIDERLYIFCVAP